MKDLQGVGSGCFGWHRAAIPASLGQEFQTAYNWVSAGARRHRDQGRYSCKVFSKSWQRSASRTRQGDAGSIPPSMSRRQDGRLTSGTDRRPARQLKSLTRSCRTIREVFT